MENGVSGKWGQENGVRVQNLTGKWGQGAKLDRNCLENGVSGKWGQGAKLDRNCLGSDVTFQHLTAY